MAYLNVVRVDEALNQLKNRFKHFEKMHERVQLNHALGRCLAQDIMSSENLPSFRRSMVDGYALIASDAHGASEQAPIVLRNSGRVEMGKSTETEVINGHAVYVPTGGSIPEGADAVVMIEHTEEMGPDIAIYATVAFNENVVGIGDDVKAGTCVLKKGTRIYPQHGGLLASLGHSEIDVIKPIKVAILSTGDELVDITDIPAFGEVRDCNATIIRQLVTDSGAEVVYAHRVPDHLETIRDAIRDAMRAADVVLLSGGSSAGTKDHTQTAIDSFSEHSDSPNVFIHGLAIKPGKPTIIGQIGEKAVIGLPGHPAACFIVMKALIAPFLNHLIGKVDTRIQQIPCEAQFQLHAAGGRDVYQLVKVDSDEGQFKAHILYGKSGMVSAMSEANAYVVVPMHHEGIRKGDKLIANLL